MNTIIELLTESNSAGLASLGSYALNLTAALLLGTVFSLIIQWKSAVSKSFALTIALLPPVVCAIFMMVNGSVGAGVAVVGAFSLVRFRSVPGSGREIMALFISMALGLTCGTGNLIYALIFAGIVIAGMILLEKAKFGEIFFADGARTLTITIPENLNYRDTFDDPFERYTSTHRLSGVKTTNMGSLFKLTYEVRLKDPSLEKEFLDDLRVRNGNLEIYCTRMATGSGVL